MPRWWNW